MTPQNALHKAIAPSPAYLRYFFFISGIIATIAYRIIFLLDSFWIEVTWYIGTIGFALYFGHRMFVENKRAQLVKNFQLTEAVQESAIPNDKKTALLYLIKTSLTSKARFNSAFIFISSVVVLAANAAIDLYNILQHL